MSLFGVPVDALSMEATVARCLELVDGGGFAQQTSLNASKVVLMEDVPTLRELVSESAIVSADGQSVVWASRLIGRPVPQRVAGIDLMEHLLLECARRSIPVYFLGAREDVVRRFAEVVSCRYPALGIAGYHDGYFEDDQNMARVIARSGARVLFVAMPSPRKELLLREMEPTLENIFAMGVGGSFDVWAGATTRAPRWMQRAGLEWAHRLVLEPRRMWRRYLVGNTRFAWLTLRYAFAQLRASRRTGRAA